MSQKHRGAYYTPEYVARSLVKWAVRDKKDRLLDPSCGDGEFVFRHPNSVGVEQDATAAKQAAERAPWAKIYNQDFFSWASTTNERFECAAGNPPFIRYQTFKGEVRQRALDLCAMHGATFSGLSSSWAPFLVASATLLKPGGRLAFVVPAEIGHAPYAIPLLDYLTSHFEVVHIIAVREKLFSNLSEDCWLLYTEGFSGLTNEIRFTAIETFRPLSHPPKSFSHISVQEWRRDWKCRLRPFLLNAEQRELYLSITKDPRSRRFGDLASIGIGYVSGANDFFHLKPSSAEHFNVPREFLHPTVRNGRALPAHQLTAATVMKWQAADDPILLLRLPKERDLPRSVLNHLNSEHGRVARNAYKCRTRDPWYSVPSLGAITRRREWSSASPLFNPESVNGEAYPMMDYVPRIENPAD